MTPDILFFLSKYVENLATQWTVSSPISAQELQSGSVVSSAIRPGPLGPTYLELTFANPVRPRHIVEGTVEEAGANDVLVKTWVWPAVAAHIYFEERYFDFVHYVWDAPSATATPDSHVMPGVELPSTTSVLLLGFFRLTEAGREFVHPAMAIRTFSFFDDVASQFLHALIDVDADPDGPFFLDVFLEIVDEAVTQKTDIAPFLRYLLWKEYDFIRERSTLPVTATGLDKYERRLRDILSVGTPLSAKIDLNSLNLLIQNQVAFEAAIAADPDQVRLWYVSDKQLWLVLLNAENVGIDPIRLTDKFTDLWNSQHDQLFVDERYLVIFNGPFAAKPPNPLAFPYPSEARIKVRGEAAVLDEMAGIDEDRRDEAVAYRQRRHHYLQRLDKSIEFQPGPLPDSTTGAPFETGTDDLAPVIINGAQLPRSHPDVSYFATLPRQKGLPMFGRASKYGRTYLFWLAREHSNREPQLHATFDEMVGLLVTLGVTDALITDGSDSVGLIVKGRGIIPGMDPGYRKNLAVPFALGFRRLP